MPLSARLVALLGLSILVLAALEPRDVRAAEAVVLDESNFDAYAPAGREADAIYGDYVLRNDKLTAAIGNQQIVTGRSGSRTQPRMMGANVIDLTPRNGPGAGNDQLGWVTQGVRMGNNLSDFENGTAHYLVDYAKGFAPRNAPSVTLAFPHHPAYPEKFEGEIRYTLEDGQPFILCEVEYRIPAGNRPPVNLHIAQKRPPADDASALEAIAASKPESERIIPMPDEPQPPVPPVAMEVGPYRGIFTDAVAERGDFGGQHLRWVYDSHYKQAYGIMDEPDWIYTDFKGVTKRLPNKVGSVGMQPGEKLVVRRRLFVAADLFGIRSIANEILKVPQRRVRLVVTSPQGPVADALVSGYVDVASKSPAYYGAGRTDAKGLLEFDLPDGPAVLRIAAQGREVREVPVASTREGELAVDLEAAGEVTAAVTDEQGQPLPCKIEFRGREGSPTPDFFPVTGEESVRNLRYARDGRCTQALAPGRYQAIITRGPAHDAAILNFTLEAGQKLALQARLRRAFNAGDWVSADLHTYTTLSGPTFSTPFSGASRVGRVLNLACEDVQFAPGAEYNYVSTYEPEIKSLGLEKWVASCPGIALSDGGRKYAFNEQYAFPIEWKPHWQDGGAIQRPQHCGQIEWLRCWGVEINPLTPWASAGRMGYDKLMTLMQPDNNPAKAELRVPMSSMYRDRDVPAWWNDDSSGIRPMFRDTDDDGLPDRVHHNFAALMDSLDVRTLEPLSAPPVDGKIDPRTRKENDVIDWIRMRSAGYRMTGLINSGAWHNFHGAGGVRNYIQIPGWEAGGKKPADLTPAAVIKAVRAGHVVMSTGPLLEARLTTAEGTTAQGGDTVTTQAGAAKLQVRVQCPNWITLDRVYVLRDGKPDPALEMTREKAPKAFAPAPTIEGLNGKSIEAATGAEAAGSSAQRPAAFDATFDVAVEADTQLIVVALGHGPNLRAMANPSDQLAHHVALTNPILIDRGGDGFVPQNPVDDKVEAFLRLVRPIKSDPKAPSGLIRLTLINHGETPAKDVVHVDLRPGSTARIKGPSDIPFNVEPGRKAHIDLEIELATDAQTESMLGSRPKPAGTVYVPRIGRPPGMAPARLKFVTDDFPKMDDLDERDPAEVDVTNMR